MKKLLAGLILLLSTVAWSGDTEDLVAKLEAAKKEGRFKAYEEAAKKGDIGAQTALGYLYSKGEGVAKNDLEAIRWYRSAASQGDVVAQFNLGTFYDKGNGVGRDPYEAGRWFKKAALQGLPVAQYNVALMFYNGEGGIQDYVRAHMWANLASSAGYQQGKNLLDSLTMVMTPHQIAKAQEMANSCLSNPYMCID